MVMGFASFFGKSSRGGRSQGVSKIFGAVIFAIAQLCCYYRCSLVCFTVIISAFAVRTIMLHLYLYLRKLIISMNLNIHYLPTDEVVSSGTLFASSVQRNICSNTILNYRLQWEPKTYCNYCRRETE